MIFVLFGEKRKWTLQWSRFPQWTLPSVPHDSYCLLCSLIGEIPHFLYQGHTGNPGVTLHHSLVLCVLKLSVAHSSPQILEICRKVTWVFISSSNQGLKSHSFPRQRAANTGSFIWTVKSLHAIGRTAHPYIFWELGNQAPQAKTVGVRGLCLAWWHHMEHWADQHFGLLIPGLPAGFRELSRTVPAPSWAVTEALQNWRPVKLGTVYSDENSDCARFTNLKCVSRCNLLWGVQELEVISSG